jgi:hypothetical protein
MTLNRNYTKREFALCLALLFLLVVVALVVLGSMNSTTQQATTTQAVQQAETKAATLTTEQALIEGGKKDAAPGWELASALYDKKRSEVCYTYTGTGHGIKYENVNMDRHTWIAYHSDGLEEFSNGRTDFWEAGNNPCDRMKSTAKLLDKKVKIFDLMLTPAENACMDKVDHMPIGTDKQMAAVHKAINVCFGQPTETK